MRSIAYAEYAHSRICSETRTSRKILRLIEYAEKQSGLYKPLLCFLCSGLCIGSVPEYAKYTPLRLHFFSLQTISLRLMQILIIFPAPECREQKFVLREKSCALCRGWQIFLYLMRYAEIMKAACLCRPLFVCEVCVCRLLLHAHFRLHFFSHCEQFSCALCRCW